MSFGQNLPTAKSIAAEMGMGWNLGNTMELIGVQPIPTKVLFDSVKAAGFKTVRIPAAWDMHADKNTHVIDAAWMAQVKTVVDYTIKDSLFVILNIHWDGGWVEGKVDSAATRPAMLATMYAKQGAFWKQIATTFRNYDRHLLFASANEPAVDNQANMSVLNGLHQIFVDTVRATGGNNASRTLVIQGPSTSFEHTADWMTSMPKDVIADRLMAEAHFYPYQFCLMSQPANWGTMAYPFFYWGKQYHSSTDAIHNPTWGEESYVDSQFNLVKPRYLDKNIPVVVGEFSALKRLTATGDNLRLAILSRRYFYNYVTKAALSRGMIPVAWDAGGKGDGTMTIFDRNKEGAIYDLGLLNAMRAGAGLAKLPGDTTSDYTVASGDNSLRILYSAKDSGRGQVNLGVTKGNMTTYDSVLVRAYVKGTTDYDSAGVKQYGYVSMSVVTMSKNWTWREKSLGATTMDAWKTYSIPLSTNTADSLALVPADPANIDFFALQAYSKGYRGALYVDWIVFKSKNGTSDTIYNFNQKAPEEGKDNVESVGLYPTSNVPTDLEWQTATTTKWGAASIGKRIGSGSNSLQASIANGAIRAGFFASQPGSATIRLLDLQGRAVWSKTVQVMAGENRFEIVADGHGMMLLDVAQGTSHQTGYVLLP
ncbi:MAG: glycoside hydrolase family 5 protein [Fibrobacteres bacterium]|nr:glycoside hydrolase family 5 protein [Fibrobacterota bacterium]